MSDQVEIMNLALGHVGAKTITDTYPGDGSKEAQHCTRFWDVARKQLLRAYPWGFALRTVALGAITPVTLGWDYRYAYPSDCLNLLALRVDASVTAAVGDSIPFEISARVDISNNIIGKAIDTNQDDAYGFYTADAQLPGVYDESFAEALALLLATKVAFPITKSTKMRDALLTNYAAWYNIASAQDANEGFVSQPLSPTPSWQRERETT